MDQPAQQRIELRFYNRYPRTVCLDEGQWPNQGGKMAWASDIIALRIGERRFAIDDFNTGYPFGDTSRHVRPNQTAVAHLSYADFKLPPDVMNLPKSLEYRPRATRCPDL